MRRSGEEGGGGRQATPSSHETVPNGNSSYRDARSCSLQRLVERSRFAGVTWERSGWVIGERVRGGAGKGGRRLGSGENLGSGSILEVYDFHA